MDIQQFSNNSFKIMDKKITYLKNDIFPFIKQMNQILTLNDIFENDFEIIENKSKKLKFVNSCIKMLKSNFELNQDNFNIDNKFFDFKKKSISKNQKAKPITLKSIEIFNNRSNFIVTYSFSIKILIDNKIESFVLDINSIIADINLSKKEINCYDFNKIERNFIEINELYSDERINKLKNIYKEYVEKFNEFQLLTKNFKTSFKEEKLDYLLNEEFQHLTI